MCLCVWEGGGSSGVGVGVGMDGGLCVLWCMYGGNVYGLYTIH